MSTVRTSTPGLPVTTSDQPLERGRMVGEYAIEEIIGKGGFGTVYRAHHPVIGKQVAIKILARKFAADEEIVSRFVSEARAVNQIRHQNIIDIFSFGQLEDGRHYYVMEHLEGEPLDRILARRGPLPIDEALPILRALALALDAAHSKGIAHRDLKPENIFIARDAEGAMFPKLLDFGIAKLMDPEEDVRHRTNTGVPMGTPYFMSPEQCRGRDVDSRTDIYSFGIVTYCVLTGVRPFERADYMELMIAHINDEPAPPSSVIAGLSATVDQAIAWMMKKERDQRPPTLAVAVTALDPENPLGRRANRASIAPRSSEISALAATTPSGQPTPVVLPKRRSRTWIAVICVLAIGGVVAWLSLGGNKPEPAAAKIEIPVSPTPPPPQPVVTHDPPPPPIPTTSTPPPAKPSRRPAKARPAGLLDVPDPGSIIHVFGSASQ